MFITSYSLYLFIGFYFLKKLNIVTLDSISANSNIWISHWFVDKALFPFPPPHITRKVICRLLTPGLKPSPTKMSFFTPVSPTGILPIWNYFKWSSLIQIFQTTKTEWIWTRNICPVRARLWLQILKEDFIFLSPSAKIKSGKVFSCPLLCGGFISHFSLTPTYGVQLYAKSPMRQTASSFIITFLILFFPFVSAQ